MISGESLMHAALSSECEAMWILFYVGGVNGLTDKSTIPDALTPFNTAIDGDKKQDYSTILSFSNNLESTAFLLVLGLSGSSSRCRKDLVTLPNSFVTGANIRHYWRTLT